MPELGKSLVRRDLRPVRSIRLIDTAIKYGWGELKSPRGKVIGKVIGGVLGGIRNSGDDGSVSIVFSESEGSEVDVDLLAAKHENACSRSHAPGYRPQEVSLCSLNDADWRKKTKIRDGSLFGKCSSMCWRVRLAPPEESDRSSENRSETQRHFPKNVPRRVLYQVGSGRPQMCYVKESD